jgi:hypothetical protein
MGLDDDDNGCDHDWQLTGLAYDKRPGEFIGPLSKIYECTRCEATTYDASRPANRPPLGGFATT